MKLILFLVLLEIEKLGIFCNLDVLMAVFDLCGDRAIKGNTDSGSGI